MSKCVNCPYWNGYECVSTGYCIDDGIAEDLANERDEAYRKSVESEYYDVEHDPDKEYPILESELIQEYQLNCDLIDGFAEDYPTFGEWLSECLSKDGTLERGK